MKNGIKKKKTKNIWKTFARSGYLEITVVALAIVVAAVVAIGISIHLGAKYPDARIFVSVLNNITIMFISTIATLIGLYVTAFIFLNDSLKERAKEDPTIGDAVRAILRRYRKNMFYIAVASIATIVIGVVMNLIHDSGESIEEVKVTLSDIRWILFVLYASASIFVIIWIILCSRDITNSDELIFKFSIKNRDYFRDFIVEQYELVSSSAATAEKNAVKGDEILKMSGDDILDIFSQRKYGLIDAYIKAEKDGDIILVRNDCVMSDELFGRYEIELGKIVRLLENMIGRISDNNIDKSIMNNEYRNESLKNGFKWLFAQQADSGDGVSNIDGKSKIRSNLIDVRDAKRFLDHIKYQIISDDVFERRPFDNSEVERIFERVIMAFENRRFGSDGSTEKDSVGKRDLIQTYKRETGEIISQFFDGYEAIVGYRDAIIHLTRYENKKKSKAGRKKKDLRIDGDIVSVLNYATVLKRVLLDRFMSFVRTDDLSLGNSVMDKGWFNYSELSDSNFTHSSFKYAYIENAIVRNCDLSTCSFVSTDASNTDFSGSNFSYSDLTGMDLSDAKLSGAQMNAVILRDQRIDSYDDGLRAFIDNITEKDSEESADFKGDPEEVKKIHMERIRWKKKNREGLKKKENSNSDINELYRNEIEKLRNAEGIGQLPKDVLARFGDELIELDRKDIADTNILKYDQNKNPTGDSVLDPLYDYIMGTDRNKDLDGYIAEYIKYRKYSKIDKKMFINFDVYRKAESKTPPESMITFKEQRENNYGKIYFRVAVLDSASINDVAMPGTDFSFVNMRSASFKNSDLSAADMYNTDAKNAMFAETNLSALDAYKADFDDANFSSANLIGANFVDCSLNSVNFKRALMLNSIFVKSREACEAEDKEDKGENIPLYLLRILRSKNLTHDGTSEALRLMADIENAKMVSEIKNFDKESSVSCFESDFSEAIANRIMILNLNMLRSKFIKTDMTSAFLYNSVMIYGDMSKANLANAIIIGCAFHQAGCSAVNLQKAVVYASEFTNADLSNSTINAAIVSRCNFDQTNLNKVNFTRSKINNCSFVKCSLKGINLAGVIFTSCIFCDIDFSKAIGLADAEFRNCAFQVGNSVSTGSQFNLTEKITSNSVVLNAVDAGGDGEDGSGLDVIRYETEKKFNN